MKLPLLVFLSLFFSASLLAQDPPNRYLEYRDSVKATDPSNGYNEIAVPAVGNPDLNAGDPHVKIIGWHSVVPLKRFIYAIKEGETDQLQLLKLLSAPNIMKRSFQGKEVWVYHYLWSFTNKFDPSETLIAMDKSGKRLAKNKHPVTLAIVFDNKDVVESYTIRLINTKDDLFDEMHY